MDDFKWLTIAVDACDLNDRVILNFHLSRIPERETTGYVLGIIRHFCFSFLNDSNLNFDKCLNFDYVSDVDDLDMRIEIGKNISWDAPSPRIVHTSVAEKVFIVDKAVITVYIKGRKPGDPVCETCLFNKDKIIMCKGGEKYVASTVGVIGTACPVNPGSNVYPESCGSYRMSAESFRVEAILNRQEGSNGVYGTVVEEGQSTWSGSQASDEEGSFGEGHR